MIVIDTNILSEVMRETPSAQVIGWVNAQNALSLFVTTVSIGEILYGLRIMPDGRRLERLRHIFEEYLRRGFDQRVITYDEAAARAYADVMAARRTSGRPMSVPDGQIASIAQSRGYALATRNIRDFGGIGLELINPFDA